MTSHTSQVKNAYSWQNHVKYINDSFETLSLYINFGYECVN